MKTKYIIYITGLLVSCISCVTPYQVSTRFEEDGKVYREILYPDNSSPFVSITGWQIEETDTLFINYGGELFPLTRKASQNFSSVKEISAGTRMETTFTPLFTPLESFRKQFRWFYTYYTYEAIFPEIKEKGEIPLHNFLTEEEIQLWLQGNEASLQGMNGVEINQLLQQIEEKFNLWVNRSLLEISLNILEPFILSDNEPEAYKKIRELNREEFFSRIFSGSPLENNSLRNRFDEDYLDVKLVCKLLDHYLDTSTFSRIYSENKDKLQKEEDTAYMPLETFTIALQFGIRLPGKIVYANTSYLENGETIWKIDAYRFLANDYQITATSRQANYWTFGITFLLILITLIAIVRLQKFR